MDCIYNSEIKPSYLNSCYQPIVFPQAGNNRSKFSAVDDNFLLLGLKHIGVQKDFEAIRDNWLPKKNINEIKHRIKNLTCRRAPTNVIK
jgi:hypothetical protein